MESSSQPERGKTYVYAPPPFSLESTMILYELRRMYRYMEKQFKSIVPQSEPSDEYVPLIPVYFPYPPEHVAKPYPPPPPSREFSMILNELRRMHRYMEEQFTSILREQARQRDAIVPKPQSEPSDEYASPSPVYYPPSSEHSAESSDNSGWWMECGGYPTPDDLPLPQGGDEVQAKMDPMKAQEEAPQPPPPPPSPSLESSRVLDEVRRIHRYMEGKFTSILREQARQRVSNWDDGGVVDKETHKRKHYHEGDVMEETCKKKAKFVEGSEEFGQFPADGKMINEVGHIGATLQEIGARLVSIGRTQELEKKQLAARVKELERQL